MGRTDRAGVTTGDTPTIMISRPSQITDAHLRRRAIAYLRQSSDEQVRDNIGSTAIQRDLPKQLQDWGWAPHLITVIDSDLGASGSRPGQRAGFADVLAQVATSTVSMVAVSDISRLGRNLEDISDFQARAKRHDTLLAHGNQIVDFQDPNSAFVGLVQALNAGRENGARVDFSRRARRKKAEAGFATTTPPVGYVAIGSGGWDKHSDPRVRDIIQLEWDKFRELGTVGRVVRFFRDRDILVPRRSIKDRVQWIPASRSLLNRTFRNPAYKGTYVYGVSTARRGLRETRPSPAPVYIDNHHPAYISPALWESIQSQLTANRRTNIPPLGRGEALVQGLLRCAVHGRAFYVSYNVRSGGRRRLAMYSCQPFMNEARSSGCMHVHASRVDGRVEEEILHRLTPPSKETIQKAVREAFREHDARRRAREDDLRHAEQAVAEAERAWEHVPETHPLLKQRAADRLEAALRAQSDVREKHRRHPLEPPTALTQSEIDELNELLADLPTLWRHPQVEPAQRKQIARMLIARIDVTPVAEALKLDIVWSDGDGTTLEIPRVHHADALIRKLQEDGYSARDITTELNARGIVQSAGRLPDKPLNLKAVQTCLLRLGIRKAHLRAYALICERAAQGIRYRAIADELNRKGLRHRNGDWTWKRVNGIVGYIRRGGVPGLTLPKPSRLIDQVLDLHDQGLFPLEIAARLHADGRCRASSLDVTANSVSAALRSAGVKSQGALHAEKVEAFLSTYGTAGPANMLASRLNELGLRTVQGRRWTTKAVAKALASLGLTSPC